MISNSRRALASSRLPWKTERSAFIGSSALNESVARLFILPAGRLLGIYGCVVDRRGRE